MDLSNVSVEQLKRWLSVLKLSTTGTRRQLILRLNNIPKEIQGQFNEMARQKGDKDGDNSKGKDSGDENFEDGGGTFQKEGGDRSNGKDGGIENYIEEDGETNGEDGEANDEVTGSILRIRGKRSNEKGGEQNEDGGGTTITQKTTCTTRLETILETQKAANVKRWWKILTRASTSRWA